jgi:two-component system cell cycle response regulator
VSARVLIADGDVDRGRAIAAACVARGLVCRLATHGAATLETALADVPEALVCQLHLPLIDGAKLAAILHANPRTRGIAIVYLGDRPGDAERPGLGGQVVAAPVDPAIVAGCVQTALGGGREVAAEAEGPGGVEGQLAQLPLADLLQLFHVSRKTGVVEVVRGLGRRSREVGRVSLRAGDVVAASVGSVTGKKALFRLLAWDRGSFAFRPGAIEDEPSIQTPTRALLREGLRQIREWQRMAVDLPPMSASVSLTIPRSALPNVIHPLTQEVLVVLDLCSRVQDVVNQCTYPDYQVLRTLHTLIQRGMVELQREAETPDLAREVRLFSPARTARLREWLAVDTPGGPAMRDAKLLVVASNEDATRDFAGLLRRLPGVEIDAQLEAGGVAPDDLMPIGRVAVDPEVGIELLHVPAAERFAAVWPVAAHAALGTLVLLSGPVGASVELVRAAGESLGAQPGARLFHLLLLEKGERVSPDELQQNLAIVDEGSLFLIPLESAEKAAVLLRELFGRILP